MGFPPKRASALPTAWTDAVGKPSCWQSCRSLCQQDFANNRRFPVGEGNGSRADGVPPSPTVHVAVGEAFPTGLAFLLAKSSFPSLKTPTVLFQQEFGNPVGKAFANRVGVRSARFLLCAVLTPFRNPPITNCSESSLSAIEARYVNENTEN
jgi:hypothetical protein